MADLMGWVLSSLNFICHRGSTVCGRSFVLCAAMRNPAWLRGPVFRRVALTRGVRVLSRGGFADLSRTHGFLQRVSPSPLGPRS